VTVRDMPLKAEAVEQRLLHHPPLAHHRQNPRFIEKTESEPSRDASEFFNGIRRHETSPHVSIAQIPAIRRWLANGSIDL
jgi:hypothetical protein